MSQVVQSWIFETFVATTVLMLVVLMIRSAVAARFGAHAAYLLWLAPALRMVMPPLPEHWAIAPAQQIQEAVIVMTGVSSPAAVTLTAPESGTLWPVALAAIWLGGAALFFIRHIFAYRRFVRKALAGAEPFETHEAIAVRSSAHIVSPLALGILGKAIIVPHDFTTRFDATEQRLALSHELTHHRRGDPGINLVALIMLALHWFNPIAHIAHRAFRLDQEAACDAIVLNGATPCERHAYGSALFKAATGAVPLAVCAMGAATTLKTRLRRIAAHPRPIALIRIGAAVAGVFVITGVLLTASNGFAAKKAEQSTVNPQAIVLGGGIIDTKRDSVENEAEKAIAEAEAAVESAERAAETASAIADKANGTAWASDRERAKADVTRAEADFARASADLARANADSVRAEAEAEVTVHLVPAPPSPPAAPSGPGDEEISAPPAPPVAGIASKTRCPEGMNRQEIRTVQRKTGVKPQEFNMVICIPSKRAIQSNVLEGLKAARATIAAEISLSEDQRKRALKALDGRIASLSSSFFIPQ